RRTRDGRWHQVSESLNLQPHPAISFGARVSPAAVVGLEAKPLDGLNNLVDVGVDFDLPLLLLRVIWRVHDFVLSVASRTRGKTKTARPSGRRFATSPAEILFGESPHPTSAGIFDSLSRHRGSPLPGCQTHFGVVPDVCKNTIDIALAVQPILCQRFEIMLR